jgi:hypothetical protein
VAVSVLSGFGFPMEDAFPCKWCGVKVSGNLVAHGRARYPFCEAGIPE